MLVKHEHVGKILVRSDDLVTREVHKHGREVRCTRYVCIQIQGSMRMHETSNLGIIVLPGINRFNEPGVRGNDGRA